MIDRRLKSGFAVLAVGCAIAFGPLGAKPAEAQLTRCAAAVQMGCTLNWEKEGYLTPGACLVEKYNELCNQDPKPQPKVTCEDLVDASKCHFYW